MPANLDRSDRFSPQLREGLKTTIMGLGLMRLQMDIGQIEEARVTLASLQIGYEHLIFDNPMETLPRNNCSLQNDPGQEGLSVEINEPCLVI